VGTVATTPSAGLELVFVIEDGRVMWTRRDAAGWAPFTGFGELGEDVADARQVEVGQHEVCVVAEDDVLRCAPYGVDGLPDELALVAVDVGGPVAEVALGSAGSGYDGAASAVRCARLVDGRVRCQGSNAEGSVGSGAALVEPTPMVVAGVTDARRLALGSTATVAFSGDASVARGWGTSTVLGVVDAIAPSATILPDGFDAFTFGRPLGDEAYAWGPVLGLQLRVDDVTSATRLVALPYAFVDGLAASSRDAGLTAEGGVVTLCRTASCDSFGAMGDGAPLAAVGSSALVDLSGLVADEVLGSAAAGHHCAIGSAGGARQLACWGRSQNGQVGTGSTTAVVSPAIVIAADVVDACVGAARTCAVVGPVGERDVWCWGQAGNGGPLVDATTPALMPGTDGAAGVTCGSAFTCAWLDDGSVRCWGENTRGQLGDGTFVAHDAPAEALGLDGVVDVVAGSQHACAIHDDGAVSCWGRNHVGQLGLGVPIVYDAPVDVALGGGG
jgi:hypothetical protein